MSDDYQDRYLSSSDRVLNDIETDHHFRTRQRKVWQRPKFHRYVVADRGFRVVLNRYPHHVLGAAVVVGRHAYCVNWATLGPAGEKPR